MKITLYFNIIIVMFFNFKLYNLKLFKLKSMLNIGYNIVIKATRQRGVTGISPIIT